MPETAPRPGQATFAAWMIIGGSVILVLTAYQRISTLHTLEVQEELMRVLSEQPLSGTGLGLSGLKTIIRVLCMIAAAAATASTILGVQALRRSTGARLALTLLAPLVLIAGFATPGFFAPMVVAGVCMLWLRPTRDWFAGRPWATASSTVAQRRPDPFAPQARPDQESAAPPTLEPPPQAPSAPATARPAAFEGEYGAPDLQRQPTSPYAPAKRPAALIAACVIVWASCALVSGFMVLFSLVMAVARDDFFDEIERQQPNFDMRGLSEAELATGTYVATAFVLVWCVAATVLAVMAIRRVQRAQVPLVVCVGLSCLVLLVATFLSPFLVVLLAANVVTVWLLLRSDVAAWFKR
jgi:hypothetical protein